MKLEKKEIVAGLIFALFIAVFINYSSIEQLLKSDRVAHVSAITPTLFSILWFSGISIIFYLLYVVTFNTLHKVSKSIWIIAIIIVITIAINYLFIELFPIANRYFLTDVPEIRRPAMRIMQMRKGMDSDIFKYGLISILNLLFVYIQRLLYRNQEIKRHNAQLQLQNIKSQHSALIQQVNPHFFFNSLGSLRHIIIKEDKENAVEFLDNLTMIFRKTLKLGDNTQHTIDEEMELTKSYIHIIEKRFEGKIFFKIEINEQYREHILSPLSLLTLIENIVKHNTVSAKRPIEIKIYTTNNQEIVIENTIVPKFEEVESNGIGLINLNKQYELLTGKSINISSTNNLYQVTLPIITANS